MQSKLQINIRTASSLQLMKDLKSGQVDLIVSVNPDPHKNTITHTLFLDQFSFFSRLSTDDKNTTFITVPNAKDSSGKTIEEYMKQFGINKLPREFGTHMIGFSFLKNRESNSSVQWIYREMLRYLKVG